MPTKKRRMGKPNFGPPSVHSDCQRQGGGTALMEAFIDRGAKLGYGAILFVGCPAYYPRFGFVEAAPYGNTDCDGYHYPVFMAMELK